MKIFGSGCAALLIAAGLAGAASAAAVQDQAAAPPVPALEAQAERGHLRVADAGDFGAGLAVGIIGSLIAQGIAEEHADRYGDSEWRWRKCDREFRSFEWDTGMYTTYEGDRRVCPYLR